MTQNTSSGLSLENLPPEMVRPLSIVAGIVGGIIGFIGGGIEGIGHHLGGAMDLVLAVAGAAIGFFAVPYAIKRFLAGIAEEKEWCDNHGWTWLGGIAPWSNVSGDVRTSVKKSRIFDQRAEWRDVMVRDTGGDHAILCRRISRYVDSNGTEHDGDIATFIIVRYKGGCPDTTIESRSFTWLPVIGGRKKVEFESADFNKHWNVQSEDAKAAYDRIDQSVIDFLQRAKLQPSIELIDEVLIIKFDSSDNGEENREAALRWAEDFSRSVPDDLLEPLELMKT